MLISKTASTAAKIVLAVGCTILFSGAGSTDWKYLGGSVGPNNGNDETFFDRKGIVKLPDRHVRVWMEGSSDAELMRHKLTSEETRQAADRIAHHYVVEVSKVRTLTSDLAVMAVMFEAMANGGAITTDIQMLLEIDCAKDMNRTLSIHSNTPGHVLTSDTVGAWTFNAPQTNAEYLKQLVCE
jgi:hypothetical protein